MGEEEAVGEPPRWRLIGPGLVVAATGVGAADLVATLIAGSEYRYALLWCVILGCVLKIVLVEGAARYCLAARSTIYEGWSSLGRWTHFYFGPYLIIWGFVYGAAAMAGTGLALHALFSFASVQVWGILSGLIGLVLVWGGKYASFEKIISGMVLLMFVSMVGAAVLTLPNLGAMLGGLVPSIPEGSIIKILAVTGGVGGTITLAAYGYWLREKGWASPKFIPIMRLDNITAYVVTGLFVISTLIVGAELLYSANIAISESDRGLLDLANVLSDRYGAAAGKVFLIGFWAAAMSSLIGVWNGVSLMFADFVSHVKGGDPDDPQYRSGGRYYRFYILWLTFPPIIAIVLGNPVWLILAYGVLGAFFMPFLSVTLLWLLNTDRTPREWRNGPLGNFALIVCTVSFASLAVYEIQKAIGNAF